MMIVKDDLMSCNFAFFDIRLYPCRFLGVITLEILVEFDHIVLYIVIKVVKIFDDSVSPGWFGVSSCRAIEKREACALQSILCFIFFVE